MEHFLPGDLCTHRSNKDMIFLVLATDLPEDEDAERALYLLHPKTLTPLWYDIYDDRWELISRVEK